MTDKPLFSTAPKEVVDYFDRRPRVPTFDWRDIAPREHALAFTVAKTHGFDILSDLRDAVRKAVVDRVPYERFRDELIPILRKKGWWGEQKQRDPKTGELVKAQLGSPRRLQIIYWANVHSAHAAGEWARVERNKEFLPWLTYVASVSERKRPLHLSWVGTTLPVSDTWWQSHYPPNGWNCKCSVRQIGDREAGRLHKEFGRDKAPPLDEREWHNKRTGETENVPAGIDPGWHHNPGLLRDRTLSKGLQTSLDRLPEAARRNAVDMLVKHPIMDYVTATLGARPRSAMGHAEGRFSAVVGMLTPARQKRLGATTSIVRLSGDSAAHIRESHPEMSAKIIAGVSEAIRAGEAFMDQGLLISFLEIEGKLYRFAVKRTVQSNETYLASAHRSNPDQLDRWRATRESVE